MTTTPLPDPRTLLFIGDSITDCQRNVDPDGVGHGYVCLLAEHFAAHEPTASVINRGISGNKVSDLVERFIPDCMELDPQVVTIYAGVNDSWHFFTRGEQITPESFEEGYRFMLGQLGATQPPAQVLVVIPFVADVDEARAQIHSDLDVKVAILRELAQEFGHPVVDLEQMLEYAWSVGHRPETIAEDGVHPTDAGHRLIADAWLAAFAELDHPRG